MAISTGTPAMDWALVTSESCGKPGRLAAGVAHHHLDGAACRHDPDAACTRTVTFLPSTSA